MKTAQKSIFQLATICICILICAACGSPADVEEEKKEYPALIEIATADELQAFFEEGGAGARLMTDIDMKDGMLKLTKERGAVKLEGGNHALRGVGACVIRLEDGCSLQVSDLHIASEQIGIGFLGDGTLYAKGLTIDAADNAIQAAGALLIQAGSELQLTAKEGSGIDSVGLHLEEDCAISITGKEFAVNTKRGDIILDKNAKVTGEAHGDNTVKTEGMLILGENAQLIVKNLGDHNAAMVGTLQADPSATLDAEGGANGLGLFIVELYQDVTLHGRSTPGARVEAGKGTVVFSAAG